MFLICLHINFEMKKTVNFRTLFVTMDYLEKKRRFMDRYTSYDQTNNPELPIADFPPPYSVVVHQQVRLMFYTVKPT